MFAKKYFLVEFLTGFPLTSGLGFGGDAFSLSILSS